MKKKIGVYSSILIRAKTQIENLVGDSTIIKRTNNCVETNDSIYYAYRLDESSRGLRNHYVYVDKNDIGLKSELINVIVLPTLSPAHSLNKETTEKFKKENHIFYF